jgi:predicted nucleic acid-binding protein
MMVLDTNVVSEIMRPSPNLSVIAWLDAQNSDEIYLNSVVTAELLFGVASMPVGARQRQFQAMLDALFSEDFAGKVLPFDWAASQQYAILCTKAALIGKPIDISDAQIAAICLATDSVLVTRNTKHFEHSGVKLINPWD